MCKTIRILFLAVFCVSATLSSAGASQLNDFHKDVADAYAHYRGALFYLRTGNDATGALELDIFGEKWGKLADKWGSAPPDAFADDPGWRKSIADVSTSLKSGLKLLDTSTPDTARKALLPIRNILHLLRQRNGLYTFSDCIEEMQGEITEIWRYRSTPPDFADLAQVNAVKAKISVYGYLLEKCRRTAPSAYLQNTEFNELFDGAENSLKTLWDATDKRQRQRFINILRELIPFNRLIFLRFG